MDGEERDIGGFTLDTQMVVRSWDAWMARVSGIASEDARGRALADLVPSLEPRGLLTVIRDVLAHGTVRVLAPAFHQYLIACPPPHPSRHFQQMQQHVTIGPLREDDRIVGAIVTVEDVTERMDGQREDAARQAAAEGAHEAEPPVARPLENFREAIREDDWRKRRNAAEAITRGGGQELVSSMLAALRDEHQTFAVVSSALQLLAQINLDIVEPLVRFLQSRDVDLRIQATLALGEQRDARAVAPLVAALDDADTNVRFHAIEALGKLRAGEAAERLIDVARSGDFFLGFAALDALSRIGEPQLAPQIIPLLDSEVLRGAAVDALGQLGNEATVPPLTALLDNPGAPTTAIANALVSLHRRSIERFGDGVIVRDLVRQHTAAPGVRHVVAAAGSAQGDALRSPAIVLGWLEGEEVERALARLLGHEDVRREVVEGLVRFGPRVTELLVQQLDAEDPEARHAAVVALGRIGDKRATPALVAVLGRNREMLPTIAGALAKIGDSAAFEPLFGLVTDEDAAVRQAAIGALNSIGHPAMAERVRNLLVDENPRARESGVKIAAYFGYPECMDALFGCSRDPDETVRRAVLEHLSFIDDPWAVPTLTAALRGDTPRARAAAAHALGHIDDPPAVGALMEALDDSDPWVRYFATRGIGYHRAAEGLGVLERMLLSDPAMQVRLAAVEAIGDIGSAAACAALAPLAEEPGEISAAALRALGTIEHEDAWPPIRRALTGDDPRRKLEAVRAAAVRGGREEAVTLLEWTAAAGEDATIAAEAIDGLGRLAATPGPHQAASVESLIRLTAEPACRDRSISALGSLLPSQSDQVAGGLKDARAEVRVASVEALGRMRDERATAWLLRALEDSSSDVRKASIAALSHLGSRGARGRVAALARTDPDTSVRRAASFALGYLSDRG